MLFSLRRLATGSLLLLVSLSLFSGCDSAETSEVAEALPGEYQFETFRFRYGKNNEQVVNLKSMLVDEQSYVTFLSNPRFFLFYKFEDRNQRGAEGRYSVGGREVVLRGLEEDVDSGLFEDVLLPGEFTLRYDNSGNPVQLRASFSQTVNLAAFAPEEYPGFREIAGTMQIVLVPR